MKRCENCKKKVSTSKRLRPLTNLLGADATLLRLPNLRELKIGVHHFTSPLQSRSLLDLDLAMLDFQLLTTQSPALFGDMPQLQYLSLMACLQTPEVPFHPGLLEQCQQTFKIR